MGSRNDGPADTRQAPTATADTGEGATDTQPRSGVMQRLIRVLRSRRADASGPVGSTAPHASIAHPAIGHGMANLRKLRVDDVSVPKIDIVSVPTDIGRDDLVAVFRQHGFSRVPVYKGTLDHPQGLILLKDLALQHGFGATGRFSLRKLIRPLIYVPPSMPVGVLLQKMQRERVHMALVIDEYGGVDGLVTIEDLIETVIGEIEDEHDEVGGTLWKEEAPGVFLAQAMAPLADFEAAIGLRLRSDDDDDDIDTLGGIVFLRTGRVPARGEVVPHESGVEFEVVEADPRRIKRLRVRLPTARVADVVAEAETTPAK
ncbi:MAG: transporter associated domain-containing protein [Gemmobacter sp.]